MSLSKYPQGSLRELCSIAFPLMLSSFSVMSMVFVDRLLLARYSTEALNAAVNATTLGWAFISAWMTLTSISEVFVAQYHGARQNEKIGEPVWQMIWMALGSFLFFIPLSFWGGACFWSDKCLERDYFDWMMVFGPSFPLYSALCGFFVGQGKTRLITGLAILANVVNAFLDAILIFGIEGYIPSLGVKGAAIATSGSGFFQVLILWRVFLNQDNRQNYGTGDSAFKFQPFWQCLRIGLPGALFTGIEISGWASFYWMMSLVGEKYITIVGICQCMVIFFFFFAEGVSKAAITVSGNLIGAKAVFSVHKVIKAGLQLHIIAFILMAFCLVFMADFWIEQFLPAAQSEVVEALRPSLIFGFICALFYLLFEGMRLLFIGILTAAGDTVFLLVAGSLSMWFLLVAPVYLIVVQGGASVEVALSFWVFYSLGACLVCLWRFWEGKWKGMSLTA